MPDGGVQVDSLEKGGGALQYASISRLGVGNEQDRCLVGRVKWPARMAPCMGHGHDRLTMYVVLGSGEANRGKQPPFCLCRYSFYYLHVHSRCASAYQSAKH